MMARLLLILLACLFVQGAHATTRIKDIAAVQGVRDNQLVGYGLVMGLQGTGDTMRNSQFTEQSLQSMLDRMGVNVRDINLRTRNVAAVIVTADLPPFVGMGSRIDVTVTSMGDATSLKGGTLMLTALQGGDLGSCIDKGVEADKANVMPGAVVVLTRVTQSDYE